MESVIFSLITEAQCVLPLTAMFMLTKAICHFRLMTELEKTLKTGPDKSHTPCHHGIQATCYGVQNFENRNCKLLSVFLFFENPSSTNNSLLNSSLSTTNE
jgi:hypothetical protein